MSAAARAWLRSAPVTSAVTHEAAAVDGDAGGVHRRRPRGARGRRARARRLLSRVPLRHDAKRAARGGWATSGANAPSRWEWGGPTGVPHLLVMFFAARRQARGARAARRPATAWKQAFEPLRWLGTADLDGIEPSASPTASASRRSTGTQQRNPRRAQVDYSNVVALGEFLLGYTQRVRQVHRPAVGRRSMPRAPGCCRPRTRRRRRTSVATAPISSCGSCGRTCGASGGSSTEQAGGDPAGAEKLAAALVGRTRAGDPLVPIEQAAIPGIGSSPKEVRQNRFTYDQDPAGVGCPFGAHMRRANPRNADYPGRPTALARLITLLGFGPRGFRDDLMSSVRFHRILRRGREYGPGLSPEDALAPAPTDEPERGLHFICLNANISRQFEFLQNAWIMSTKFSGLTGESDPLIGNRERIAGCPATDEFVIPQDGGLVPQGVGAAAVRHGEGWGVLLHAGVTRPALSRGGWRCLVPSRSSYPAKSRRRPLLALAARARLPRRAPCRRAR